MLFRSVVTRRVNKPDGTLMGIVGVAINPNYFSDVYKTVDLGQTGTLALVGLDGIIRTRLSREGNTGFGLDVSAGEVFAQLKSAPSGTYVAKSISDGVPRVYGYQALEAFPLAVTVGAGLDEVLTEVRGWSRELRLAAIVATASVLLL